METKSSFDLNKILVSATGVIALLVIVILVNVILSYANIRWDATEDNVYSLSQGTKNILSEMNEPVTVKFFFSRSNRNIPSNIKLYAKRVEEFLSEYEQISNGKVNVESYDPKVDSDEEEWAQKYGIQPLQIAGGERVYFGLAFVAIDREETYDLADPSREELLEYDITRIIYQLQSTRKKVVGVISALPVFGEIQQNPNMPGRPTRGDPWIILTELRKTYNVREISLSSDQIDNDVDLLLIIHPKLLSQKLEFAIDQYVLSGKNAVIFVDPFCVSDRSQTQRSFMAPSNSSLPKLFGAWGISINSQKSIADLDYPTRVRSANNQIESNPTWISAKNELFSSSNVVTSGLESMLFPVAGALTVAEKNDYEYETMIKSGKNASLIDSFKAGLGIAGIRKDFIKSEEPFDIAVRIRGKFKTAFPAGAPKEKGPDAKKKEEKPKREHLKEAKEFATVMVVSDADMLADHFFVQKSRFLGFNMSKVFNDNLNFLSNACEILTGSDNLIGVRSRGKFERPFTAVKLLERKAQEKWLVKEKELVQRVESTNRKLQELQQKKDTSQKLIMSPEQEAEIAKFKDEKRRINKELKQVRKNLRADIESLGTKLKGINIFMMPFIVSIAGIGFALYRQRRIRKK